MKIKIHVPEEVKDRLFLLAFLNRNTYNPKTLSNLIRDKIYEVIGFLNQFGDGKTTVISVEVDDELKDISKMNLRMITAIAIYDLLKSNTEIKIDSPPPAVRTVTVVLRKSEAKKLVEKYGSVNRAMNICLKQLPDPLEEDIPKNDPERLTTTIKIPNDLYIKLRQKHRVINHFIRACVHKLLGD
ncbi:hypothetical protein SBV1_gp36 [Sulfolobales Beppu virus 1]|nr:hypothetical protein SBV1_gp36 [Sulfolobales Beppu virus 1]